MKRTILAALLIPVMAAQSQQSATPVVRASRITTLPMASESDFPMDFTAADGGRFIYYAAAAEIRVLDRRTNTTSAILQGSYRYVAVSNAGDRLLLLRPAEGSTNGPLYIWSVGVNPQTGAVMGEPRRVSQLAADAPRFSPDGRSIAFIAVGSFRRMVIIPAEGGQERTVFERGRPTGPVRWSPDGRWLYFGQMKDSTEGPFVVSRVSVDGGAPTPVSGPVLSASPGLTPDGRHVVALTNFKLNPLEATITAFDLEKREVGKLTFVPPRPGEPHPTFVWGGSGDRMVMMMGTAQLSTYTRGVGDRASRRVAVTDDGLRFPELSPDGSRIAAFYPSSPLPWELRVVNVGGGAPVRVQQIGVNDLWHPSWSPDGRYVSYWSENAQHVASTATGNSVRASDKADIDIPEVRWESDSKSFKYSVLNGTTTNPRPSVWQATVDGQHRMLRDLTSELPSGAQANVSRVRFLGDSSLLFPRLGLVTPLRGAGTRKLYEPLAPGVGGVVISRDGKFVAVPAPDMRAYDVYSTDGSGHATVSLPAPAVRRFQTRFLGDNRTLAIVTDRTPTTGASIYLVPTDGGAPRALVTLAARESFNDFSISPDGRSLIYAVISDPSLDVIEIDLRPAMTSPRPE